MRQAVGTTISVWRGPVLETWTYSIDEHGVERFVVDGLETKPPEEGTLVDVYATLVDRVRKVDELVNGREDT